MIVMAIENASEIIEVITPALAEKIAPLITIFKAVGIAFIVYVIYLMVKMVLGWKNQKRIKRIEKKVNEIEKKLDLVLNKKIKKIKKRK